MLQYNYGNGVKLCRFQCIILIHMGCRGLTQKTFESQSVIITYKYFRSSGFQSITSSKVATIPFLCHFIILLQDLYLYQTTMETFFIVLSVVILHPFLVIDILLPQKRLERIFGFLDV